MLGRMGVSPVLGWASAGFARDRVIRRGGFRGRLSPSGSNEPGFRTAAPVKAGARSQPPAPARNRRARRPERRTPTRAQPHTPQTQHHRQSKQSSLGPGVRARGGIGGPCRPDFLRAVGVSPVLGQASLVTASYVEEAFEDACRQAAKTSRVFAWPRPSKPAPDRNRPRPPATDGPAGPSAGHRPAPNRTRHRRNTIDNQNSRHWARESGPGGDRGAVPPRF